MASKMLCVLLQRHFSGFPVTKHRGSRADKLVHLTTVDLRLKHYGNTPLISASPAFALPTTLDVLRAGSTSGGLLFLAF